MAEILKLGEELRGKLHPYALKRFLEWIAEVKREIPQLGPTLQEVNLDANAYLNDGEKARVSECQAEIVKWLRGCIDIDGYSPYPYCASIIYPMSELKSLLKKMYERKAEKAEAERREKEEVERWRAASIAVNPPINDAKRYLDRPGEYNEFIQATLKAIKVNVKKGQGYLYDSRTFDYRWWLKKINDRKMEEMQEIAASSAAQEYNTRLNEEKARLKALLCPNRKDHESYFKKQIKDRRYTGENFSEFLSSEEKQDFDKTIINIGRKKLDEIVSSDYREFIDGECWRSYFLLPSAEYSLEGVPCLNFTFDVFAVVEVRVWLKPRQKTFGDYVFNLPWREENGYPVPLHEPEFLGYHYLALTSEDLGGYSLWQSIPLVLLKGLLNGETRPNGTTISAATDSMITYKIPRFKEEVDIPGKFALYLKNIGNIDQMVSMGIIAEKVGSIIKSELSELKIERDAPSLEDRMKGKDTKKAKAFQLFREGKGPTSPEVKALGMHKSTRFRYYNQYVAGHKPSARAV